VDATAVAESDIRVNPVRRQNKDFIFAPFRELKINEHSQFNKDILRLWPQLIC
jgi:hypothetical protein